MKKGSGMYILLAIAIIVIIVMLLLLSPFFYIKNIKVNGLIRLEEAEVIRALELDKDNNILTITRRGLKAKVKNNFYIEDIQIEKKLPDEIIINIKEREIIGYIPYIGDYLYIDKNGLVVDIKPNYTEKLPIIDGILFDKFNLGDKLLVENEEAFGIVMEMTNIMYEKEILNNVVKIDMGNTEDIHLYIGEIDVILGDSENLITKVNILNEILIKLPTNEKGYLYIDDINKPPIFEYVT